MSNIMQYKPEPIKTQTDVKALNSEFRVKHSVVGGTHIILRLWVWQGNVTFPFDNETQPTVILYKKRISIEDTEIEFELSDYIRNSNQVFKDFKYFDTINSHTRNVVYFKYEWDIINNPLDLDVITPISTQSSRTYLGHLGWTWYGNINEYTPFNMSFGYNANKPLKYYSSAISYKKTTYAYNTTSTDSCVVTTHFTPPANLIRCQKDGILINYIGKDGHWEYFTPFGKVEINNPIKSSTYNVGKRYENNLASTRKYNTEVRNIYKINTGLITEAQGQYIEEIMYSPRVFITEFLGTKAPNGKYTDHRTFPVIVKDTNFSRKTRVNDGSKISYSMTFEMTDNKII